MELIVMILLPFPLGFFVRSRVAAYVSYLAVHGFVFTFQTLVLLLEWMDGKSSAFGDDTYPHSSDSEVLGYGLVNLAIFAAGLGLVALGAWLAARRRGKQMPAAVLAPSDASVR